MDPIADILKRTGWTLDEMRERLEMYGRSDSGENAESKLDENTTKNHDERDIEDASDAPNCSINGEMASLNLIAKEPEGVHVVEQEVVLIDVDDIKDTQFPEIESYTSYKEEVIEDDEEKPKSFNSNWDPNKLLDAKVSIEFRLTKNALKRQSQTTTDDVIEISDDEDEKVHDEKTGGVKTDDEKTGGVKTNDKKTDDKKTNGQKTYAENEEDLNNYQFSLDDCEIEDTEPKPLTENEIKKDNSKINEADDIRSQLKRQLELLRAKRHPSTVKPSSSSSLFKPYQIIPDAIVRHEENKTESEIKIVEVVGGYQSPPRPSQEDNFHGYFPYEVVKSKDITKRIDAEISKINVTLPRRMPQRTLTSMKTTDIRKIKGLKYRDFIKTQISKTREVPKENKDSDKNGSSNSAFISQDLENYLTNNSRLNISYEIPSLKAENAITLTDLGSTNVFSRRPTVEARPEVQPQTMAPKKYKPKTLAEKRALMSMDTEEARPEVQPQTIAPKIYKPKTLAEKRTLMGMDVEEDEISLVAWRDELVYDNNPFVRHKFVKSTKVANANSFVLFNGRKIKIASWKRNQILARIQDKPKPIKKPPKLARKATETREKPSILEALKPEPIFFNHKQWEPIQVKLPKVKLDVTPSLGKPAHPKIRHFISNENEDLKEKEIQYALTALRDQTNTTTFTFDVSFENNKTTFELLQKIPNTTKCIENNEEICKSIREAVDKMLDYVDTVEETRDVVYEYADISDVATTSSSSTLNSIKTKVKDSLKTNSVVSKTTREMKRLNCKILSVDVGDRASDSAACNEEYCKLGCICSSIKGSKILRAHCRSIECMFDCKCKSEVSQNVLLSSGTEILNDGVLNRLDDEAKKDLARVEKEFTTTVVYTNNHELIMLGEKDRKRRAVKPIKYGDFVEDDSSDELDDMPLLMRYDAYVAKPYRNEKVDSFSLKLQNHDFSSMIPYCMIHNLYRCYCLSQELNYFATSDITTFIPYSRKSFTPLQLQAQCGLVRPVQNSAPVAPKRKAAVVRNVGIGRSKAMLPPKKKEKKPPKRLTFNKEDHTSRTRGVVTTYYLQRNRTESHLNTLRRTSKKLEKQLDQYLKEATSKMHPKPFSTNTVLNQYIRSEDEILERRRKQYLANFINEEDIMLDVTSINTASEELLPIRRQNLNRAVLAEPKAVQEHNSKLIVFKVLKPPEPLPSQQPNLKLTESKVPKLIPPSFLQPTQSTKPVGSQNVDNIFNSLGDDKNLRLYLWSSLMTVSSKPSSYFWFSTKAPTVVIITTTDKRPTIHHSKISMLNEIYDTNSLHSGLIRCLVTKTPPKNTKIEDVSIIIRQKEHWLEIVGIAEKNNLADDHDISISMTYAGHVDLVNIGTPVYKYKCEATEKLVHLNADDEWKVILYKRGTYLPRSLLFQDTYEIYGMDLSERILVPLPSCRLPCKWMMIFVDEIFAYIKLTRNEYSVCYTYLIKCMQLAQNIKQTVILDSSDIQRGYHHANFGFYFTSNYMDRFFVGPYYMNENKDLNVLKYCEKIAFTIDVYNQLAGKSNQTYYWLYQSPDVGITEQKDVIVLTDTTESTNEVTDAVLTEEESPVKTVDLTDEVNDEVVAKKIAPILKVFDPNYCEAKLWTGVNESIKGEDMMNFIPKGFCPADVFFKRLNNIRNARYIVTDIKELGFIPANCFDVSKMLDYLHPLKNCVQRCHTESILITEIKKLFQSRIIHVPPDFELNVRIVKKAELGAYGQLNAKFLNGYYMVGAFGFKNVYKCTQQSLRNFDLSPVDIETIISKQNKRLVVDIILGLAKVFETRITPTSTLGGIITSILKKVVLIVEQGPVTNKESLLIKQFYNFTESFPTDMLQKIEYQLSQLTQRYQRNLKSQENLINYTEPVFVDVNNISNLDCATLSIIDNSTLSTSYDNLEEVNPIVIPEEDENTSPENCTIIQKIGPEQPIIVDVNSLAKPKPVDNQNGQFAPKIYRNITGVSENSACPVSLIPVVRGKTVAVNNQPPLSSPIIRNGQKMILDKLARANTTTVSSANLKPLSILKNLSLVPLGKTTNVSSANLKPLSILKNRSLILLDKTTTVSSNRSSLPIVTNVSSISLDKTTTVSSNRSSLPIVTNVSSISLNKTSTVDSGNRNSLPITTNINSILLNKTSTVSSANRKSPPIITNISSISLGKTTTVDSANQNSLPIIKNLNSIPLNKLTRVGGTIAKSSKPVCAKVILNGKKTILTQHSPVTLTKPKLRISRPIAANGLRILPSQNLLGQVSQINGNNRFILNPNVTLTPDQHNILNDVVKQVYLTTNRQRTTTSSNVTTANNSPPLIVIAENQIKRVPTTSTSTSSATSSNLIGMSDEIIEIDEEETEDVGSKPEGDDVAKDDSSELQNGTLTSLNDSKGIKRVSSEDEFETTSKVMRTE